MSLYEAFLTREKLLAFWVLLQVLLKSISIAHTAFPVENSSSAPAPALTATHLWSESTAGAWGAMAGGTDIFLFG